MSDKIRHAIQFNQMPPFNMQLSWIDVLDKTLSNTTKDYIEHGNLDLRILAILIRDTLSEAKDETQIDGLLWYKLHDQDLVIKLMGEIL